MPQQRRILFVRRNGRVCRLSDTKGTGKHPRRRSNLLRLPKELRIKIYEYTVTRVNPIALAELRPPPLALVNRQLFKEVLPVVFRMNAFTVDASLTYLEKIPGEDPMQFFARPRGVDVEALTAKHTWHHTVITKDRFAAEAPLPSDEFWNEWPKEAQSNGNDFTLRSLMRKKPWLALINDEIRLKEILFIVRLDWERTLHRRFHVKLMDASPGFTLSLWPVDSILLDARMRPTHEEVKATRAAYASIRDFVLMTLPDRNWLTMEDVGEMVAMFDVGDVD